jgi:diguanylate cyclase (GGDEF)-like protein
MKPLMGARDLEGSEVSCPTRSSPRSFRGHLKVEVQRLPAAVLTGILVALAVTVVSPLRPWLMKSVDVDVLIIVALGLAVGLLTAMVIRQRVRLRHLDRRVGDLQEVGRIDPLTGAYRKAEIKPALRARCEQATHSGQGFAVIFIDIDNSKRVNDQHNHDAGDFVLEQFGDVIRPRSPGDLIFRYGGEEFLIVTKPEAADAVRMGYQFASRLQREVAGWEFLVDRTTSTRESLSISCGVTDFGLDADTPDGMISRADSACMRAKKGGRNRVEQLGFVQSQET